MLNRTESKRKVSEVFNNSPQGSRLGRRPKNDNSGIVYKHVKKCKTKNWTAGPLNNNNNC